MKKTNKILKATIAMFAVTILVACKKEIDRPQASNQVSTNSAAMITKGPGTNYIGQGTLGDSTAKKVY